MNYQCQRYNLQVSETLHESLFLTDELISQLIEAFILNLLEYFVFVTANLEKTAKLVVLFTNQIATKVLYYYIK